jgi:hypothetical protein
MRTIRVLALAQLVAWCVITIDARQSATIPIWRRISVTEKTEATIGKGLQMRYMILMQGTLKGSKQEGVGSWPPEDITSHIGFMMRLNKSLAESGELVSAEGLDLPDNAKLVRATTEGPPITDGPFPETKEFLAGFWIVDVESEARAIEIAATVSAAPGKGGVQMNFPVEVRQIMSAPSGEI